MQQTHCHAYGKIKAGFASQGVVVIGGTLIWEVGLLAGLGVAMLPLRKFRQ